MKIKIDGFTVEFQSLTVTITGSNPKDVEKSTNKFTRLMCNDNKGSVEWRTGIGRRPDDGKYFRDIKYVSVN